MKIIEGFATSSTAIVNLFLCSVDSPLTPGRPTIASLRPVSSISSITSSTNAYRQKAELIHLKKLINFIPPSLKKDLHSEFTP
jgi:hypothetical protein